MIWFSFARLRRKIYEWATFQPPALYHGARLIGAALPRGTADDLAAPRQVVEQPVSPACTATEIRRSFRVLKGGDLSLQEAKALDMLLAKVSAERIP